MSDHQFLLWETLLLALASGAICLVAVRAGAARCHWFLRALAVGLCFWLLYPICAIEPMLVFMLAMPLIAFGSCVLQRRWAATESRDDLAGNGNFRIRLRFRTVDVLLATLLAGLMAALASALVRQRAPEAWTILFSLTVGITVVTQLSVALVSVRGWWKATVGVALAISIFFAAAACDGFKQDWTGTDWYVGLGADVNEVFWYAAVFFIAVALFIVVVIILGRATQLRRPWLRWAARMTLVLLSAVVLLPLGALYWLMVRGPVPAPASQMSPNSFPRVVATITRIGSLNPNEMKLDDIRQRPDPTTARQLEVLYGELMQLSGRSGYVSLGLGKDAMPELLQGMLPEFANLRTVAFSWSKEAESAAAAGRYDDASRYGIGSVHVGNMLGRGGLKLHSLTGVAVEGMGKESLISIRAELSAEQARQLLGKLEVVDSTREPPEWTIARDAVWTDRAFHRLMRYRYACASLVGRWFQTPVDRAFIEAIRRRDTTLRLLMADLAIRVYRHDHGRAPTNLGELVPEYLAAVPIDPYSGSPIVYRLDGSDAVLYSIGSDGRDDGGHIGSYPEELLETGFDIGLDGWD